MSDIVVPICNTTEAAWATREAIALYRADPAHIHLVNVQRPLPRHVSQFFSRSDLHDFHRDTGMRVLEPAMRMLDDAGVPHEDHVLIGRPAETIVRFAEDHGCCHVIVDAPASDVRSMLGLGSIGSQVRHLMQLHAGAPVTPPASRTGVTGAT
ncbi:MAG TPA: universal stress protein [Casimicrobiaceae bacterium]|nr:universal stress protein [Casimicrobiaceae bacterium]